ncbi:hypothetical protein [Brevundimonas sp. GN22]
MKSRFATLAGLAVVATLLSGCIIIAGGDRVVHDQRPMEASQ